MTNLLIYATITTVDRQYADCYQRETEYYRPTASHQVAASAWWGVEFLRRVWNGIESIGGLRGKPSGLQAFRELGHEAYSCDIQDCSGGHPEWHIKGDVLPNLNPRARYSYTGEYCGGGILFYTCDYKRHYIDGKWDLIIAHPPCTYLTLAGNKWFKPEFENRFPERKRQRQEAIDFFMQFVNADCQHIAIENPVGVMSSQYRKPDQYIEPYYFGDAEKKKTGLWLKGLPLLTPTNVVEPVIIHCSSGANEPRWHMETMKLPKEERSRARSKTFPSIAKAMAEQWGKYIEEERKG